MIIFSEIKQIEMLQRRHLERYSIYANVIIPLIMAMLLFSLIDIFEIFGFTATPQVTFVIFISTGLFYLFFRIFSSDLEPVEPGRIIVVINRYSDDARVKEYFLRLLDSGIAIKTKHINRAVAIAEEIL